MKKQVKDGWHTVKGYEVYVEGGKVTRAVSDTGQGRVAVYTYRITKEGTYIRCNVSLPALRAGLSRGSIRFY